MVQGNTDGQRDDRIIQWDFDPLASERVVVKLVFNAYVESAPEYNEIAGRGIAAREALYPINQWRQVMEHQTRTNDDGSARMLYNNINCEIVFEDQSSGDDQPKPKFVKRPNRGRNSPPAMIATAFKEMDVIISPGDVQSEAFINHFFEVESREVQMGPRSKRFWFPTRHFGDTLPDDITPVLAEGQLEATAESGTW